MDLKRNESRVKSETWKVYRRAFENFSEKVRRVQSLSNRLDRDQAAIDTALLELAQAREAYSCARDAVAREIQPALPIHAPFEHSSYVKDIAALLWEVSGRPEGTANDDWFRAEKIVRRARANASYTTAA